MNIEITDTQIGDVEGMGYVYRPLPMGAHIRLTIGPHHIDVRVAGDHVKVNSPDGALKITPRASNDVEIRVGDW